MGSIENGLRGRLAATRTPAQNNSRKKGVIPFLAGGTVPAGIPATCAGRRPVTPSTYH